MYFISAFSLSSCRVIDSEQLGNNISGKSSLLFSIVGTEYSNNTSSAGLKSGVSEVKTTSVLVDPSNITIARLSPSTSDLSSSSSASANGVSAYASSGLPLSQGTKFRVIAYNSNGDFAASQDYTVGSPGVAMMLDFGGTYTIVAYSYNRPSLPALSALEQGNISSASVSYDDTNRDFLYYKTTIVPNSLTSNTLNITLRHKVAFVTTSINSSVANSNINSVSNALITPHYSNGNFSLNTGSISGQSSLSSGASLDFSGSIMPAAVVNASGVFVNAGSSIVSSGFSANVNINNVTRTVNLPGSFNITPGTNSTLSINLLNCGAYIGPGPTQWKPFMCFNLGADTTQDPFNRIAAIHGAKYQWGYNPPNVNQSDSRYVTRADDQASSQGISGWNGSAIIQSNVWNSGTDAAPSKGLSDPCPSGYRVPTRGEWLSIIGNSANTITRYGTWQDSPTTFDSGIRIANLYLPASGGRDANGGFLYRNNNYGNYWSSLSNSK